MQSIHNRPCHIASLYSLLTFGVPRQGVRHPLKGGVPHGRHLFVYRLGGLALLDTSGESLGHASGEAEVIPASADIYI